MQMEDKRVIEVDEYQQRLIIGSLNETRNELVAQGRDTDFVDETLLDLSGTADGRDTLYTSDSPAVWCTLCGKWNTDDFKFCYVHHFVTWNCRTAYYSLRLYR